eukprot:452150-Pleurochrysis_carterae.AAC.1
MAAQRQKSAETFSTRADRALRPKPDRSVAFVRVGPVVVRRTHAKPVRGPLRDSETQGNVSGHRAGRASRALCDASRCTTCPNELLLLAYAVKFKIFCILKKQIGDEISYYVGVGSRGPAVVAAGLWWHAGAAAMARAVSASASA